MASHESGGSPSDIAPPPDAIPADTGSSGSSYAGTASATSTPACPYRTSTLPDHQCSQYLDCPAHTLERALVDDATGVAGAEADDPGPDTDTHHETDVDLSSQDAAIAVDADAEAGADAVTESGNALVVDTSDNTVDAPDVGSQAENEEAPSPTATPQTVTTSSGNDPLENLGETQPDTVPEQAQASASNPVVSSGGSGPPEAASSQVEPTPLAGVVSELGQEPQEQPPQTGAPLPNSHPEPTSAASSRPSSSSSSTRSGQLISSAGQQAARRAAAMAVSRRATEFALPPWQPDSEVTQCPICGAVFSFFNRKHHCRKCGRVVCADCSPHRITIPHPYIVRAPGEISGAQRSADGLGLAFIGGGMRVRLCNPCVPDPNTTPPQSQPQSSHVPRFVTRPARPGHLRSHSSVSSATYADSEGNEDRLSSTPASDSWSRDISVRSRSATVVCCLSRKDDNDDSADLRQNHMLQASLPRSSAFLGSPAEQGWEHSGRIASRGPPGYYASSSSRPLQPQGAGPFRIPDSQNFRHVYNEAMASSSSASPSTRGFHDFPADYSRPPASSNRLPVYRPPNNRPLPRPPQIPEEDECPVCHNELPSRTLPNFETLREQHITTCITAHSTYSPLPALPGQPGVHGTPPPRVMRRTGMFPYVATEKDCAKGDECTICLDEYAPGVKLARLECLCRFHHECIMEWFETHPGRCPVHQHDQFGY